MEEGREEGREDGRPKEERGSMPSKFCYREEEEEEDEEEEEWEGRGEKRRKGTYACM